ncbi:protein-L-isoaspartate(D-aspartate) O-methyltransferase [Caldimonas tepidiphila]|uniref:protein-L-isoaspartate(D-aspartate) O-methyltransferase n=1 Tax=Caldimonas tepidiphila TaxID=2315841 RepID=UPI001F0C855B|nr:protein-L-isoaspartate(D-aspartate) O-methyltransferase [Caldimonas tepidiphila]
MSLPPKPGASRHFPLALDRVAPVAKTLVSSPVAPRTTVPAVPPATAPRAAHLQAPAVHRPQRPLQQAAQDRARLPEVPGRPGPDLDRLRRLMVQRLAELGLRDPRVREALLSVPRHHFVDPALLLQAYEDTSLPIGFGQTISKPSVVARMLELLCAGRGLQGMGRVLEIGTGCGYQAALLGLLARQVVSIERLRPLHEKALALLQPLRHSNVRLVYGDGCLGFSPQAPYDGIIAAAGGGEIPAAWLAQLAPGGRLVAPVETGAGAGQVLLVVDHLADGRFLHTRHEAVHFVPLKSGVS